MKPVGTLIVKRGGYRNDGRPRVRANVWLPTNLLGSKTRTFWEDVSPYWTHKQIEEWAADKVQQEFAKLKGDSSQVEPRNRRGLFTILLDRHANISISHKTGTNISRKTACDNKSTLKALFLFWIDRLNGWQIGSQATSMTSVRKDPAELLALMKRQPKTNELTAEDAEGFKHWLMDGRSPASTNSHLRRIQSMFSALLRTKQITENPFTEQACGRLLVRSHGKSIYSLDEEQKIFDALHSLTPLHELDGWYLPPVDRETQDELAAICEIASRTGLRRVAVFNDIKVENYDSINRILKIEEGRKGGRAIAIPVSEDLHYFLQVYRMRGGFWSLRPDGARELLRCLLDALGIEIRQPFHGFRHTLYSRVRDVGGMTRAKDLMGHALHDVDKAYTHATEVRCEKLRAVLENVPIHKTNLSHAV